MNIIWERKNISVIQAGICLVVAVGSYLTLEPGEFSKNIENIDLNYVVTYFLLLSSE